MRATASGRINLRLVQPRDSKTVDVDRSNTMNNEIDVIAGLGLDRRTRKSHWPARLDFVQSASGLFLGLFMWGHMAFVSTILISKDAMWWVTKMFEGQFLFGRSYPGIVAAVVALVTVMFVLHGLLAMRTLPANFQECRIF